MEEQLEEQLQINEDVCKKKSTKEEAIAFYKDHNVTNVLENLLNTMFLDSPQDIYGYMSEFFHSLSQDPCIASLEGCELYDSNGDSSLSLTLNCIVNGINKPVGSYVHVITKPYEREEEGTNDDESGESYLNPFESLEKMCESLCDICLKDQIKINSIITQGISLHPSSQTAVSRITALSLAKFSNKPLFISLNHSFEKENSLKMSFTPPLPLVPVLLGGLTKLKVRGFYLLPSPLISLSTGIQHVIDMYKELGRALASKQGPAATSINGGYYYSSDKPEAIMELLKDVSMTIGIELNKDVMVVIDVGGDDMYDEEKKKYEFVIGQWKTGDEIVSMLSNLASTFSGLIGFIDPFHSKDISSWKLLREQVSSTSLLMSDRTLTNLPLMKEDMSASSEETGSDSLSHISCGALSHCHNQTLNKCFDEASHLRGLSNYCMFSLHQNCTPFSLSFDVDLAVALHCKFIKINAPFGITTTVVLSRLKEIQSLLESLHLQEPSSALIFPCES